MVADLFKLDKWQTLLEPGTPLHNAPLRGEQGVGQDQADDTEWGLVKQLLIEDWCGLLEFPVFVWQMVLPRALHAQMRAHRCMSFFSESHQLSDASDFADDRDYFQIPGMDGQQQLTEEGAMVAAQQAYRNLVDGRMLPALARGVLPMHINLGLSVAMSLRSMFQMAIRRRCHILQGTYWNPLLDAMCCEVVENVDERLRELFEFQPCDVLGRCLSPSEQDMREAGKDPHATCPRWEHDCFGGRHDCRDLATGCDAGVECLLHQKHLGCSVVRRNDQ